MVKFVLFKQYQDSSVELALFLEKSIVDAHE